MGSWGVSASESDCGLDLLGVATDRYLRGVKFKALHVKHITEILRAYTIEKFIKESYGWEAEYIDFFYNYTFHYNFAHAVILVAECVADFLHNGKLQIYDYEADKNRHITKLIYTDEDLEALRKELQSVLDPKHGLYKSWQESDCFNEWHTHIQTLCDTLLQAIRKGGDGHG